MIWRGGAVPFLLHPCPAAALESHLSPGVGLLPFPDNIASDMTENNKMAHTAHESPDDLIVWLQNQKWSDYARKCLVHLQQHGSLTAAQRETLQRMRARGDSASQFEAD